MFAKSGWTQREIAEELEMHQTRVGHLLRFGKFLKTSGLQGKPPKNLTERKFRGYWSKTNQAHTEAMLDHTAGGDGTPPLHFRGCSLLLRPRR